MCVCFFLLGTSLKRRKGPEPLECDYTTRTSPEPLDAECRPRKIRVGPPLEGRVGKPEADAGTY